MFLFRWIGRMLTLIIIIALIAPGYAVSKVWQAAHNPIVRSADVIVNMRPIQRNRNIYPPENASSSST